MSVFVVMTASRGGTDRLGWIRRMAGIAGACAVGFSLVGCSSAETVVPAAPVAAPALMSLAPETITVPLPTRVSLQMPTTPLLERRNGEVKLGRPYEVAGTWYYPSPGGGYDEEGIASWYGPDFQGKSTANGETYNMDRLTAAHPTLPMPCYVAVTNLDNGRSVVVRVNDRGPYKAGRIIDLSHRAAQLLDVTHVGTAHVRVRYLKMAPLMADERFEQQFLSRQPWYRGPQFAAMDQGGGGPTRALANARLRLAPLGAGWQPDIAASR